MAATWGDVPVMPATVLGLELLLQEPFVDLGMASELVLSDVGATLQILRLIGSEYDSAEERPSRMEDCIASLDVEDWFGAITAATFTCDGKHAAATAVWKHSCRIAQYAQLVAEALDGVCPKEAYLVGLLHEIGTIPALLGWRTGGLTSADTGSMLAEEWSLPLFLVRALRSLGRYHASSVWKSILSAAHQLAEPATEFNASRLDEILPLVEDIRATSDVGETGSEELGSSAGAWQPVSFSTGWSIAGSMRDTAASPRMYG